jgi:hypothetical protein
VSTLEIEKPGSVFFGRIAANKFLNDVPARMISAGPSLEKVLFQGFPPIIRREEQKFENLETALGKFRFQPHSLQKGDIFSYSMLPSRSL